MGARKGRGSRNKADRRRVAELNQSKLVKILESPEIYDLQIRQSSARHLVKISQRHRLQIPSQVRHLFCKKCGVLHQYGTNARVRILAGQRVTTCLECSTIRRFGGGPKSHRRQASNHMTVKVTTSTRRNSEG